MKNNLSIFKQRDKTKQKEVQWRLKIQQEKKHLGLLSNIFFSLINTNQLEMEIPDLRVHQHHPRTLSTTSYKTTQWSLVSTPSGQANKGKCRKLITKAGSEFPNTSKWPQVCSTHWQWYLHTVRWKNHERKTIPTEDKKKQIVFSKDTAL